MVVTLFFWSIIIIVPVHISFQSSWRMTWSNCYHHSNTHKSLGGMMVLAVPRPFRTSCWSTLRFVPQISEIHKFRCIFPKKNRCAHHKQIKQLFHNSNGDRTSCMSSTPLLLDLDQTFWVATSERQKCFSSCCALRRTWAFHRLLWRPRSWRPCGRRRPGGKLQAVWTMKVVAVVACACAI